MMWRFGFLSRTDGILTWANRPHIRKRLPVYKSIHFGPWVLAVFRYESDPSWERPQIIGPDGEKDWQP